MLTRWIRRGLILVVTGGIAAAIAWSFVPRPLGVDTSTVVHGPFEVTVDADGVTRVKETYVVSSPVAASLERIALHPGDRVEAGAVVARLSAIEAPLLGGQARLEARARLLATRAGLRQAETVVARTQAATDFAARELTTSRTLAAQRAITAQELDRVELEASTRARELESARFGARIAAHEVELAQAAINRLQRPPGPDEVLELRSPVAGRVLRIARASEGVIAPGAPIVEIADPAALEVVVDVATVDAVAVTPGAPVQLERWGGDGALRAHVRLVEPAAFTKLSALGIEEQRVNVVIDLDEAQARWSALGDGYRVEARITVWRGADVVQIPSSALFRDGSSWAVFLWQDGRAHLRHVAVGRRSGVRTQVTSGLAAGEIIILHPGDAITDGVRVEPR